MNQGNGFVREEAAIGALDEHCLSRIMWMLDDPDLPFTDCKHENLQACSLVSRGWLEVSNFVRKSLDLKGSPQVAKLPLFLSRFPDVWYIQLTGAESNSNEDLQTSRSSCELNSDTLGLLALGCPWLRCLLLLEWAKAPDAAVRSVLVGCLQLERLWLKECGLFSETAFQVIQQCARLEQLHLLECPNLTSTGLKAIAGVCPALRRFSVKMDPMRERVDLSEGLESVASLCHRMRDLLLQACGTTDATLHRFAIGCPGLSDVALGYEPGITDAGVVTFRQRLPRLTRLRLSVNSQLNHVLRRR